MTDRIAKKDVDAVIENLNDILARYDLKLRYYSAYGTYRIGLILNLETGGEKEYKHKLNHNGVHLSLLNFQRLLWLWTRNNNGDPIERDTILELLDCCGFTYSR